MAEPGDPPKSTESWPGESSPHDHDDLIGFTSPRSLAGTTRVPEPPPVESWTEPAPRYRDDPTDDLFDADPPAAVDTAEPEPAAPGNEAPSDPEGADDLGPLFGNRASTMATAAHPSAPPAVPARPSDTDLEAPPPPSATEIMAAVARPAQPIPDALPAWARETPRTSKTSPAAFGRSRRAEPPEGAMSLYAVYALILFAVPTFGVAALIALVSVVGRRVPTQDLAASHFIFQKRTLWIAAVGAALGVVLIAVNLGVFVLVGMALWVIVRGAAGLIRLAAGRPIENPLTWKI